MNFSYRNTPHLFRFKLGTIVTKYSWTLKFNYRYLWCLHLLLLFVVKFCHAARCYLPRRQNVIASHLPNRGNNSLWLMYPSTWRVRLIEASVPVTFHCTTNVMCICRVHVVDLATEALRLPTLVREEDIDSHSLSMFSI